ncbi:RDD family protein [Paracrocinitomix mangrovi]|uniref:RDD family protein n=1 Tax=Paracrocinitomix mangrovi TaxID=2862509 RepID=UPI001C8DF509|nr:RDD family protein [Paracrocinitomix mangrovi]UKN00746.1 RDD family protein [Paracrocinitomix mangrovi]
MKKIDIITAHNISIDYDAATVMNRGVAKFLDLLIIFVYAFISYLIIASVFASTYNWRTGEIPEIVIIMLVIFELPIVFYSVIMEYFLKGQTVGKMAMGIRVVKINGENANFNDYAMRWAFNLVDFWVSGGAVAALFISTTDKGQRLGDILAQTAVVKNNPDQVYSIRDILNIKDRTKHEPTYLGVSKFTDEDMILIKNAITRVKKYPNEPHKELVRELAKKAAEELNLEEVPQKKLTFLKTLLQDYIVLTR